MLRAVVDTNVLVSGLLTPAGIPGRIVVAAIQGRFDLVTSRPLIQEFKRVIRKPAIARKYRLIRNERRRIEHFLSRRSVGNPPRLNPVVITDDPRDDRVLECALAGKADYVVSGNQHLLNLGAFQGIPVVTPSQFTAHLPQGGINGPS